MLEKKSKRSKKIKTKKVPKVKEKDDNLNIENIDLDTNDESIEDDSVLLEDESDVDPTSDVGIKPTEENKEEEF